MSWLDLPFKEIDVNDVYKKDPKIKKEDVEILVDWMKKQPHLPPATELQVILFLQSCYYNIELSKRTIDIYFTVRTLSSDMFSPRNIQDSLLYNSLKCATALPLPKLLPSGEAIILGRLLELTTTNYDAIGQCKSFDVSTLLFLHKIGPVEGINVILDMSNFTFGHFLKINPLVCKKFLYYLQEGMPIRLKNVHIINVVSLLDKVMALVKPFLKKELYDSIKIHKNMESLYEYVPQELLPSEYGGKLESSEILEEKVIKLIGDSNELLKLQESQLIDKSKRPKLEELEESLFGVSGSFKKLEVD